MSSSMWFVWFLAFTVLLVACICAFRFALNKSKHWSVIMLGGTAVFLSGLAVAATAWNALGQ